VQNCLNVYCTELPKSNIQLRDPVDAELEEGRGKDREDKKAESIPSMGDEKAFSENRRGSEIGQ